MTNIIDFPDRTQSDGTPIPIILGGGLKRCGRCARTFTAATYSCIENAHEDHAAGTFTHTDVCRRCAYHDPILTNWQDLCDLMDSIDQVMRGPDNQPGRDLLCHLISHAAEHFSVWRWPDEQPPYVPDDDEFGEDV